MAGEASITREDALLLLNNMSKFKCMFDVTKITDLTVGEVYEITYIRKLNTKNGWRVVVDLDDKISVYLPENLNTNLNNDRDLYLHILKRILKKEPERNEKPITLKYTGRNSDVLIGPLYKTNASTTARRRNISVKDSLPLSNNNIFTSMFDLIPITNLNVDKAYEITGIQITNAKYGQKVVLDLDKEISVFLPGFLGASLIDDKDIYDFILQSTKIDTPSMSLTRTGEKSNLIFDNYEVPAGNTPKKQGMELYENNKKNSTNINRHSVAKGGAIQFLRSALPSGSNATQNTESLKMIQILAFLV